MHWFKKSLIVFLVLLFIGPLCGLYVYNESAFRPHLPEIRQVLIEADPADSSPTPVIRRLIKASHSKEASPATHVARLLLSRFSPTERGGMLGWHARFALWEQLVKWHLSEDEIIGLYATLSYNGKDYGIAKLSTRLFSKSSNSLSEVEAATVIAVLSSPQTYLENPEMLKARRDRLLASSVY